MPAVRHLLPLLLIAGCGAPAASQALTPVRAPMVVEPSPIVVEPSAPPRPQPTHATRSRPLVQPHRAKPTVRHRLHHDRLNWHALAVCESGDRPRAVSPNGLYRGLYQFDLRTWHGVGGKGDPINASRTEQTYRAQLLYADRGRAPWPVCGSRL